ncbi:hypothetical protein D9M71_199820 [compost metagenome]
MDALDKTVERLAEAAELVLAMDAQAPGQVAFAFGDVMHGPAHYVQRLHQHANQHAEQGNDDQHRNHRGHHRRGAQFAERGEGKVLVEHQCHVPVSRGHAVDLGEGDELLVAVQFGFFQAAAHLRSVLRVGVAEVFQHQLGLRVHEDLAGAVDDEGLAVAVEVQCVDDRTDAVQVGVGAIDADQPALVLYRGGEGDDQFVGRNGNVRLGDDGLAGTGSGLVPAANPRIVVGGAIAQRYRLHVAVLAAEIGQQKVAAVHRQAQAAGQAVLAGAIDGNLLGQRLQELHAALQPGLDVAAGQAAEFLHRGFGVAAQGLALAVIVEQDETSEGDSDHQGGGEQNLVAELQVFCHCEVCLHKAGQRVGRGNRSQRLPVSSVMDKRLIAELTSRPMAGL